MRLTWTRVPFVLGMVFIVGCGGNRGPKAVTVKGKVVGPTDKSVGPAVVILWPVNSTHNSGGNAVCDSDGSFSLQCLPGSYKATVTPIRPKGDTTAPRPHGPDSAIPSQFQNELTTTLTVIVPEEGADNVTLSLK